MPIVQDTISSAIEFLGDIIVALVSSSVASFNNISMHDAKRFIAVPKYLMPIRDGEQKIRASEAAVADLFPDKPRTSYGVNIR